MPDEGDRQGVVELDAVHVGTIYALVPFVEDSNTDSIFDCGKN